jgi:GntR family transcriptional regulator
MHIHVPGAHAAPIEPDRGGAMALASERRNEAPAVVAGFAGGEAGGGRLAVPKPLYSQVRDMLARQISTGQWAPGVALPNETALSQSFGVSIGTIRRAVEGLEDMGVVVRRQGCGTFVAGLGHAAAAERMFRLRSPRGEHLSVTRRLRVPGTGQVIEFSQTARHGAQIIGIESHVLPVALAGAVETSLNQDRSLYAALGQAGEMVTRAEETVTAVVAEEADVVALGGSKGRALLQVQRRSFTMEDRLVELATGRYLASHVIYAAQLN